MGDKTAIEWTDATWNPTSGCDRVSPGCDHCYALTTAARLKAMGSANYQNDGDPKTSGPGFKLTMHEHMLDIPLRWKRPRMIFVNSMSDLFHKDVSDHFIARVFATMAEAPQHTFQILTKRPQRMRTLLRSVRVNNGIWEFGSFGETPYLGHAGPWPLPNVWLGTSIETDHYTWRADHLRDTPAAVRFISAEPLLGPLSSLDLAGIDWLIVGAESGHGARRMSDEWVRQLRQKCHETWLCHDWFPDFQAQGDCATCGHVEADHPVGKGTALFVKQLSGVAPHAVKNIDLFPGDLRIREYPR